MGYNVYMKLRLRYVCKATSGIQDLRSSSSGFSEQTSNIVLILQTRNRLQLQQLVLHEPRPQDRLLLALGSNGKVHETWNMVKAILASSTLQMVKVNLELGSGCRHDRHS